jgi:hypothetical protein
MPANCLENLNNSLFTLATLVQRLLAIFAVITSVPTYMSIFTRMTHTSRSFNIAIDFLIEFAIDEQSLRSTPAILVHLITGLSGVPSELSSHHSSLGSHLLAGSMTRCVRSF